MSVSQQRANFGKRLGGTLTFFDYKSKVRHFAYLVPARMLYITQD